MAPSIADDVVDAHPVAAADVKQDVARTVRWRAVLPLAVLLAYADGFWVIASRTGFGAIERTQQPFSSWWRESSLTVPIFVLMVLAVSVRSGRPDTAGTRRLRRSRWFRRLPGQALALVGWATLVGVAELVVSSVYDYRLEVDQLGAMAALHVSCQTTCMQKAQQATLGAQSTAVLYVAGLLLVTNAVAVGWIAAMGGGRIRLTAAQRTAGRKSTATPRAIAVVAAIAVLALGLGVARISWFDGYAGPTSGITDHGH